MQYASFLNLVQNTVNLCYNHKLQIFVIPIKIQDMLTDTSHIPTEQRGLHSEQLSAVTLVCYQPSVCLELIAYCTSKCTRTHQSCMKVKRKKKGVCTGKKSDWDFVPAAPLV